MVANIRATIQFHKFFGKKISWTYRLGGTS